MRMPPSKVDRFTSNQDISPAVKMLRFCDICLLFSGRTACRSGHLAVHRIVRYWWGYNVRDFRGNKSFRRTRRKIWSRLLLWNFNILMWCIELRHVLPDDGLGCPAVCYTVEEQHKSQSKSEVTQCQMLSWHHYKADIREHIIQRNTISAFAESR